MGAQNTNCTMKFIDIPEDRQREAINTIALQTGLPPSSIEKDWWVTQVLKALHTLPYAEHIAFKGGTSLSKCWNLIARFSEDVDIALSREFLGFSGELSKTQISDRLRRAACSFVREKMQYDVQKALVDLGIRTDVFSVDVVITPVTTTDPEVITITYHSLYEISPYIKNTVKIEISGRSPRRHILLTAIFAASSLLSAMTAPRIKYAVGSPDIALPRHSTRVPSIRPMSCILRRSFAPNPSLFTYACSPTDNVFKETRLII